jgi:hypothetical protein
MSVLVNYAGRLGNNILQYCMGSYLAYKFDLSFDKCLDLNGDFEINNKEGGRSLESHIEVNDENLQDILSRNSIDSGIILNGWFQSKHIFENEEILSYYKKCIVPKHIDNTSDLFVHVRLGDIDKEFNLPYEYYYQQMSYANYYDCFISSDSPDHKIVKKLKNNFKNVQIFTGWNPSFVIRYGANCKNLVLSSGTFSFCMLLFNRCDAEVYCIDNDTMRDKFNIRQWHGDMFSAFTGKNKHHFYS